MSTTHTIAQRLTSLYDNLVLSVNFINQSIQTKADKVSSAIAGHFAGLDSNGNLTDSGKKAADFATAAQGAKADTALQQHQDISGKANKVTGATSGNFASLDSNGDLQDSGHKHSDYAAASHTHTKSDITDFSHSHVIGDITSLQTTLDNKVSLDTSQTITGTKTFTGGLEAKGGTFFIGNGYATQPAGKFFIDGKTDEQIFRIYGIKRTSGDQSIQINVGGEDIGYTAAIASIDISCNTNGVGIVSIKPKLSVTGIAQAQSFYANEYYSPISYSGWYRIFSFADYADFATILISKGWNNIRSQCVRVEVGHGFMWYQNLCFANIVNSANGAGYFKKIRLTGSESTCHVDVYIEVPSDLEGQQEHCYLRVPYGKGTIYAFEANAQAGDFTEEYTI